MRMKLARRPVVALLLAGLLGVTTAQAQVTTGTIVGTVKDEQGAAVPGATVTITEVNKGTTSVHTTDSDGSFMAPFLIPGTYDVAVELQSFKRHTHKGVVLQVNQRARVDVTLTLGGLTETTEVIGLAPLTRTDSGELGEVIEERAVRELPLNGRNFATLVYLVPGVTPGQAGENLSGASTFNPRGASNFNALGSQANTNAWLVDGIDNNEYTFNTVIVQPTVESVREFKVLTGTFSAEFGRGAGVVSVSTKSGQNEWHGTAFEYLRNEKFDAKNFFALPNAPKAPLDRHQFGGALSGPIIKNKTFFFVDYSGIKEERGQVFVNTVPTAATRAGDFSDYRDRNGNLILIYDPLTTRPNPNGSGVIRDPFPGNKIPANRLDQVGLNFASIYPLPNGAGNFDNYTSTVNRSVRDNSFTARIDHRASDRDSFFVRYSYEKFKLDAPQGQAACCLPTPPEAAARFDLGPFVAGIQNTRLTTHGAAVNWTHLFGPSVVNEMRLGYAKTNPETRAVGLRARVGHESRDERHQRQRLHHRAAQPQRPGRDRPLGRPGLPARQPQADPLPTGGHGLLGGGPTLLEGRLPLHPAQADAVHPHQHAEQHLGQPEPGEQPANQQPGHGHRHPAARLHDRRLARLPARLLRDDQLRALGVRAGRLEAQREAHHEPRPALRGLRPRHREGRPPAELRPRGHGARLRRRERRPPREQADPLGQLRAALRDRLGRDGEREERAARRLRPQLLPGALRGRQPARPERARLDLAELQRGDEPARLHARSRVPPLSNPFPAIVPVKPQGTAELNKANPIVFGHAFSNETPHMDTWQVSYERQITKTLMAEIAYAGSKGSNLIWVGNINEVQPGPGSQASRRLIQPLSNVSQILYFDTNNSSSYNGLQLKLNQRFSNGLQFLASYTFAKSLDYAGSPASGGGAVGGPQSVTLFDESRGPSGFDVKHRFVLSYVWALPFGKGHKMASGGIGNALFGNWQFSGIVTLSTGRPFTVFLNTGVNNGAPSWPDRIGDGKLDNPSAELWFDINDFKAPAPNHYGTAGRGILYAPGVQTVDASLSRRFPLKGGRFNVQFRADTFNLFNTPQLGFPNQNIGSPTAGRITSLQPDIGNRQLQFALKLDF